MRGRLDKIVEEDTNINIRGFADVRDTIYCVSNSYSFLNLKKGTHTKISVVFC